MGSIPILPANILKIKDMNRFKLVCIGVAVLITAMIMCSCVANVEAAPQASGYSITRVHYDVVYGMNIYKVTTPRGTFEVLWEKDKGGLCVLK